MSGTVMVERGQAVRSGDVVGRVGHTSNSTVPHLHFQLMDSPDPLTAKGLPCSFRELEIEGPDGRRTVRDVMPRRSERIRFEGSDSG